MPKQGDIITISAVVLAVDKDARIVVLKRVDPKPTGKAALTAADDDGGFAIMWGT